MSTVLLRFFGSVQRNSHYTSVKWVYLGVNPYDLYSFNMLYIYLTFLSYRLKLANLSTTNGLCIILSHILKAIST